MSEQKTLWAINSKRVNDLDLSTDDDGTPDEMRGLVDDGILVAVPVVAHQDLIRITCTKYGCGVYHSEGHLVTYYRLVTEWQRANE